METGRQKDGGINGAWDEYLFLMWWIRHYKSSPAWSQMSLACRRTAPPGFRAAPRAVFAVTAIRRQSLTPSRLWRCALRLL
ncbi:hypothetical protein G8E43_000356 [Salmonella enterica]|nr:hypothetical protein [Salmonella enterica]EHJ9871397.1 hypothetical protein [Salmonella enterica subsp. enterica serovar 4,[5],12:i:-]